MAVNITKSFINNYFPLVKKRKSIEIITMTTIFDNRMKRIEKKNNITKENRREVIHPGNKSINEK